MIVIGRSMDNKSEGPNGEKKPKNEVEKRDTSVQMDSVVPEHPIPRWCYYTKESERRKVVGRCILNSLLLRVWRSRSSEIKLSYESIANLEHKISTAELQIHSQKMLLVAKERHGESMDRKLKQQSQLLANSMKTEKMLCENIKRLRQENELLETRLLFINKECDVLCKYKNSFNARLQLILQSHTLLRLVFQELKKEFSNITNEREGMMMKFTELQELLAKSKDEKKALTEQSSGILKRFCTMVMKNLFKKSPSSWPFRLYGYFKYCGSVIDAYGIFRWEYVIDIFKILTLCLLFMYLPLTQ